MSEFVEQCRREWRRLGVPDPLAEEMATDLASDLRAVHSASIRPGHRTDAGSRSYENPQTNTPRAP
jgi:hypothetical protein